MSGHVNIMRDGVVLADYPIETASVQLSRTAAQRRTCKVTLLPDGLTTFDTSWKNLFAPYGNEIRLWYQINFPDGTSDEVCLGTFAIWTTNISDTGTDFTVKISGYDRSKPLDTAEVLTPYAVPVGNTVDAAITQMIKDNWSGPQLQFQITPTDQVVPGTTAMVRPGKTIWSQALLLAQSVGYELFFDVWGNLVGRPLPDPTTQSPVYTFSTVLQSGTKDMTLSMTRDKVYSAFSVTGTGSYPHVSSSGKVTMKKGPLYGPAYDLNVNSPTYYNGPFGKVGHVARSTLVDTVEQATTIASSMLMQQQGTSESLTMNVLPLGLLDAWDVVGVANTRLGVQGTYVIDGWDLTLHYGGEMALNIRPVVIGG